MGEEPVGDRDDELEKKESRNITLKERTRIALENEYPHALELQEAIRAAIHEALEDRDVDDAKNESE